MPAKARSSKIDRRLLGSWKSDAKRTFADWSWKKGTTSVGKARLKSLFGKLEITYTRNRIISRLPHLQWEEAQRYTMLGTDAESAAIVIFGKHKIKDRKKYDPLNLAILEDCPVPDERIEHIHFGKDYYWVYVGNGRNREFFRRMKKDR